MYKPLICKSKKDAKINPMIGSGVLLSFVKGHNQKLNISYVIKYQCSR